MTDHQAPTPDAPARWVAQLDLMHGILVQRIGHGIDPSIVAAAVSGSGILADHASEIAAARAAGVAEGRRQAAEDFGARVASMVEEWEAALTEADRHFRKSEWAACLRGNLPALRSLAGEQRPDATEPGPTLTCATCGRTQTLTVVAGSIPVAELSNWTGPDPWTCVECPPAPPAEVGEQPAPAEAEPMLWTRDIEAEAKRRCAAYRAGLPDYVSTEAVWENWVDTVARDLYAARGTAGEAPRG